MKHLLLRLSSALIGLGVCALMHADQHSINGSTYQVAKGKVSHIDMRKMLNSSPQRGAPPCPPPLPFIPEDSSVPLANPNALPGAFFPNQFVSNLLVPPPQTLGLTFVAGNEGISPSFFGTPPDTYGVKGLTQFVISDNNGSVSFDSNGNRDNILDTEMSSLSNLDGNLTLFMSGGDARIQYDRLADRFITFTLTRDFVASSDLGSQGYFGVMLAVSDSGVLTDDTQWTIFTIFDEATVPNSNGCPTDITDPLQPGIFFDYPSMGIDANAIYITSNLFENATGAGWATNNLLVIQKKSLYSAEGPVVITSFPAVTLTVDGNFVGDQFTFRDATTTLFPLNNFDDPNPAFGYAICQDPVFFGKLRLYRILNAGSTSPSIAGPFIIDVMQTYVEDSNQLDLSPFLGQLYGSIGSIQSFDDRLANSSHINKKQIYTAHSIMMNNQGISSVSGDRKGIRWYQLDVTGDPTGNGLGNETVNTVPALVQAGSLYDTAVSNPLYYIVPAIMSNSQGDISICGTVSGVNQPPSAFFVGKAGTDPKDGTLKIGTVQPNVYATGSGHFTRSLGARGGNGQRWGDMSYSSLDPADKKTIWTIQEIIQDGLEVEVVAKLLAP